MGKIKGESIRKKNEIQEVIVEVGGGYKGLSVVVALVSIGMFALSLVYANYIGIILFFLLVMLNLYNCMSQLTEKYYISEDGICAVRFMRKRKQLLFSEIKYMQEKQGGSTEFIVLYSEKGKELSINKAYKNVHHLEQRLRKKVGRKNI